MDCSIAAFFVRGNSCSKESMHDLGVSLEARLFCDNYRKGGFNFHNESCPATTLCSFLGIGSGSLDSVVRRAEIPRSSPLIHHAPNPNIQNLLNLKILNPIPIYP